MEKIFDMVNGFLKGLGNLFMTLLPVAILWQVLSGTTVFGMDVITNLSNIVTSFGQGGFVGLVVLLFVASFFVDKK